VVVLCPQMMMTMMRFQDNKRLLVVLDPVSRSLVITELTRFSFLDFIALLVANGEECVVIPNLSDF